MASELSNAWDESVRTERLDESSYLETLACACAATQDFNSAVKYERQAINLTPADTEFVAAKKRLDLSSTRSRTGNSCGGSTAQSPLRSRAASGSRTSLEPRHFGRRQINRFAEVGVLPVEGKFQVVVQIPVDPGIGHVRSIAPLRRIGQSGSEYVVSQLEIGEGRINFDRARAGTIGTTRLQKLHAARDFLTRNEVEQGYRIAAKWDLRSRWTGHADKVRWNRGRRDPIICEAALVARQHAEALVIIGQVFRPLAVGRSQNIAVEGEERGRHTRHACRGTLIIGGCQRRRLQWVMFIAVVEGTADVDLSQQFEVSF